jgi:hypothetical protein
MLQTEPNFYPTEPAWSRIGRFAGEWQSALKAMKFTQRLDAVSSDSESSDARYQARVEETRSLGFFHAGNSEYFQHFEEDLPEFAHHMRDLSGLEHPVVSMILQNPGQCIPWHRDQYFKLRLKLGITPERIARYLVFLEDWQTGHYFEVAGVPCVQWKKGDVITFGSGQYHLSGNLGLSPKLTLQITGVVNEQSWHLNPGGERDVAS